MKTNIKIATLIITMLLSFNMVNLANANQNNLEIENEITEYEYHLIYFFKNNVRQLNKKQKNILLSSTWSTRKLIIKTLVKTEELTKKEIYTMISYLNENKLFIIIQ